MNTVSLIIYLSNVLSNFSVALGVSITILIIGTIIYTLGFLANIGEVREGHPFYKYRWTPITIIVILAIISIFVPDRRTMIAIAASETTEMVINSDIGKQGQEYVKEFLQKEITSLKEENVKKDEKK